MTYVQQFVFAKNASRKTAILTTKDKNNLLHNIASALEQSVEAIVLENQKDIALAESLGGGPMIDRLLLNSERIRALSNDVRNVATLPDKVGEIVDESVRPNGLQISRIRVPLGVVGMIYESRPNVTVDASVLAIKSGNAIILKGGKEAICSNRILVRIMREAIKKSGFSPEIIQFLDTTDRLAVTELLQARGLVDLVIPRGGKGLISFVVENAKVPVVETGASVVHTFVDESVELNNAVEIVANEKLRRVSVCNALDTLLIHKSVFKDFFPMLLKKFEAESRENGFPIVKIHADKTAMSLVAKMSPYPSVALEECDFETEWLDYELTIKVVENIYEAIEHIQKYSLGHSESICSNNQKNIDVFLQQVDAACVYANASTCFSDGAQFGLGAEIGISTQKIHVRGPFALQGLTSTKWVIRGDGQIRK